jgi:hypothetical protein
VSASPRAINGHSSKASEMSRGSSSAVGPYRSGLVENLPRRSLPRRLDCIYDHAHPTRGVRHSYAYVAPPHATHGARGRRSGRSVSEGAHATDAPWRVQCELRGDVRLSSSPGVCTHALTARRRALSAGRPVANTTGAAAIVYGSWLPRESYRGPYCARNTRYATCVSAAFGETAPHASRRLLPPPA